METKKLFKQKQKVERGKRILRKNTVRNPY